MNLWLIVIVTLISLQLTSSKFVDKSFKKKVATKAKPTKHPKSIVEEFTELPADDVEFIKELDKQFKIHGDKIRIQVERENTTAPTKNSKRTIDGEVGYGYRQVSSPNAYRFTFSRPRYMLYPYSQHDIPPLRAPKPVAAYTSHSAHHHPTAPQHDHSQNAVQIQPSHAFEIKETGAGYQTYTTGSDGHQQVYVPQYQQQGAVAYQHHPQQQVVLAEQYVEPVIVLRIPGPAKYAAHLQALLQQYLEVRAAQYIRALEEQEAQQQQQLHEQQQHHHHQQVQQHSQEQVGSYEQYQEQPASAHHAAPHPHTVYQPVHQVYQPVQYQHVPHHAHQTYQAPVQYETSAETGDRHQQIKENLQQQLNIEEAHVYDPNEHPSQPPAHQHHATAPVYQAPQHAPVYDIRSNLRTYLTPVQQHAVYGSPTDSEYATATLSTVASHATRPVSTAAADHSHEVHSHANHIEDHPDLPISENYPRNTHTKVVFTGKDNDDNTSSYPLTPIPPTASSFVKHHRNLLPQFQTSLAPTSVTVGPTEHQQREQVVAITQRPRGPFNYHAHLPPSTTLRPPYKGSKFEAPYSEEQFRKLNKLINRLKRKNGSTLQLNPKEGVSQE